MPLIPSSKPSNVSRNIAEFHTGKTFRHTAAKFGKERANKQAIAVALNTARKNPGRASGGGMSGGTSAQAAGFNAAPISEQPQNMGVAGFTAGAGPPVSFASMNSQPQNAEIAGFPAQTPSGVAATPSMTATPGVTPFAAPPPQLIRQSTPTQSMPTPIAPIAPVINPIQGAPVPQQAPTTATTQAPQMQIGMAPPAMMGPSPNWAAPIGMGGAQQLPINRAFGGAGLVKTPSMNPTWQERNEARSMTRGPILSAVPGRTDAHQTHVPSGSYVIPADIVSGRGQGNTIAGAHMMQQMFHIGPYGSGLPKMGHGMGMPRPPKVGQLAKGGGKMGPDPHLGKPVRVNLAGGEVVVPPENLMAVVHPNLKHAHAIMDTWVLHERKKLRKTLAKLPGPAKD